MFLYYLILIRFIIIFCIIIIIVKNMNDRIMNYYLFKKCE